MNLQGLALRATCVGLVALTLTSVAIAPWSAASGALPSIEGIFRLPQHDRAELSPA